MLKYDDVMNQQREIIYGQRRKVLDGEDISAEMHKMLRENIDSSCASSWRAMSRMSGTLVLSAVTIRAG